MKPLVVTYYSPQGASDFLGIPKSTILAAIERGELPAIKYNQRLYRVTAIDCAAWYATKGGRLKSSTTSTTPTTPKGQHLPASITGA